MSISNTQLIEQMNTLLANYQVQYMNARGFHWHIQGRDFFELHAKFEEIYTELLQQIDDIAERILTLGGTPDHQFQQYLQHSRIESAAVIRSGQQAVQSLIDGYEILLQSQRQLCQQAAELDDEGTSALMSDFVGSQEKLNWMLKAYVA